jgi:hypothetical protein
MLQIHGQRSSVGGNPSVLKLLHDKCTASTQMERLKGAREKSTCMHFLVDQAAVGILNRTKRSIYCLYTHND